MSAIMQSAQLINIMSSVFVLLGSVPLPVVTARIDRFFAEGGKGLNRIWSELVSVV
jgi:hypothetical protein